MWIAAAAIAIVFFLLGLFFTVRGAISGMMQGYGYPLYLGLALLAVALAVSFSAGVLL